ncbi:hypothetical protein DERF_007016, partial [Dermatophagoides farinae]
EPFFNDDCNHRDFYYGSTVCVCNENHCDTMGPLPKTPVGIIQVYETSRNGHRFRPRQFNFQTIQSRYNVDIRISLNRKKRYQKIIGFGGAFSDSSGLNIKKLSQKLQIRLLRDYFGSDGIEYSAGRIPIGGTDFSPRPYTYADNPGNETLSNFSLQTEDFQYKIPYIKMAQKFSSHRILYFGSAWGPPAWMKTNNDISHGGYLRGRPEGKYYKMFAQYIVKFIQAYQKQNIHIWGITIVNEPIKGTDPEWKWNCLALNSTLERDFLKLDLGPELYRNGFKRDRLAVMIYDDQLPRMKSFAETIMNDENAAKYVSGVAFHWYENDHANRNDMDDLYKKYPGIFILASEACELRKNDSHRVHLGSWKAFNHYANDIIEDLNHYSSGWIDWNLALNTEGGPSWAGNLVDAPIIINTTGNEYYKQPTFYAMGHFSKFLTPDSIRLHFDLIEAKQLQTVQATVFERPDHGIVMIILNQNKEKKFVEISDPKRGQLIFEMQSESMASFLWY